MVQNIQPGLTGENSLVRQSIASVHAEISIQKLPAISEQAQAIIQHVAQSGKLSATEKAWAVRMAAFIDEYGAGNDQMFRRLNAVIGLMESTAPVQNSGQQSVDEWKQYYQKMREVMHAGQKPDGDMRVVFDAQIEQFVFENRGIKPDELKQKIVDDTIQPPPKPKTGLWKRVTLKLNELV